VLERFMSEEAVIRLASRRQALRRRWRQLKKLGVILAVPAADQESYGAVLPFKRRVEPLLGHFNLFPGMIEAAPSDDERETSTRRSRRLGLAARWRKSRTGEDAAPGLSMQWSGPEPRVLPRPHLAVIAGGRAERDLGV
jgi:hypothetical protein